MGIPKNLDYISIQGQTLSTDIDYHYFKKGIEYVLKNLNPKNVLVYTSSERVKKILKQFTNANFIFINTIANEGKKKLKLKGGD
jgi:guanylate kinase